MTAALIFRRQLVRHSPLYLQQAPRASKLPLEKFHRLLDLTFWGEHQKISMLAQIASNPFSILLLDIYLFFVLCLYRVLLRPGCLRRLKF